MQKFICEQNIVHFQKLLNETTDSGRRRTLEALLLSARRDLSLLESKLSGAEASPLEARLRRHGDAQAVLEQFKPEFEASAHSYMLIDPAPGLRIVDINEAYARATLTRRDDVVGQSLFDIFPDNPDDSLADGVINLFTSLRTVVKTNQAHTMAVQRYDIRDLSGNFVERHWLPINSPVHDSNGILIYLLHHVEDVTAEVKPAASNPRKAS
jgi:PAS domain-containing protein